MIDFFQDLIPGVVTSVLALAGGYFIRHWLTSPGRRDRLKAKQELPILKEKARTAREQRRGEKQERRWVKSHLKSLDRIRDRILEELKEQEGDQVLTVAFGFYDAAVADKNHRRYRLNDDGDLIIDITDSRGGTTKVWPPQSAPVFLTEWNESKKTTDDPKDISDFWDVIEAERRLFL